MATDQPELAPQKNKLTPRLEISPQDKSPNDWQERLLPLMTRILTSLTVFFFVATFIQLGVLYWNILQVPEVEFSAPGGVEPLGKATNLNEQLTVRKLEYSATLEAYSITRRYHQAAIVLASSLWLRYLGFVTGMILALVGASFILGKLQEPLSELTGKWSALDISLKSASPGIILAVLGVILMLATIVDVDKVDVKDGAIYFANTEAITVSTPTSTRPIVQPISTPTVSIAPTPITK
ncbi:MAG: hypothetical protein HZB51_06870 [Chloroflexi bacterium]|nr:hypothetical protein [Chloroflexota bacterium]